eukprot:gene9380-6599_t
MNRKGKKKLNQREKKKINIAPSPILEPVSPRRPTDEVGRRMTVKSQPLQMCVLFRWESTHIVRGSTSSRMIDSWISLSSFPIQLANGFQRLVRGQPLTYSGTSEKEIRVREELFRNNTTSQNREQKNEKQNKTNIYIYIYI